MNTSKLNNLNIAPNEKTKKAIIDLELGNSEKFSSVSELINDLNFDEENIKRNTFYLDINGTTVPDYINEQYFVNIK